MLPVPYLVSVTGKFYDRLYYEERNENIDFKDFKDSLILWLESAKMVTLRYLSLCPVKFYPDYVGICNCKT
jgi:hypothetical protein